MSTAIIAQQPQQLDGIPEKEITLWRQPEQILSDATRAAKALQSVLAGKKNPVKFNGEQYLEFEDWQVLCQFFHLSVGVETTEFVEFGSVQGFKATAVLRNDTTGEVISRAESMCLNNEDNWGMVTEYEWKDVLDGNGKKIWDALLFQGKGGYKREKVKVGEKAKPLFQIMSMAQTRACAKACRNKLSWVVVMAGYKPTPVEEMAGFNQESEFGTEPPSKGRSSRKQAPKPDKVVCASCGATDSHAPTCKHHPSQKSSTGQPVQGQVMPKKEEPMAKQSTEESFFVNTCNKKKLNKGTDYLELIGKDDSGNEAWRYVWHGHLQKEPCDLSTSVGKLCVWDISSTKSGDKTYYSVEKVHSVGTQAYSDDKPVASPSAQDVGFDAPANEDIPW